MIKLLNVLFCTVLMTVVFLPLQAEDEISEREFFIKGLNMAEGGEPESALKYFEEVLADEKSSELLKSVAKLGCGISKFLIGAESKEKELIPVFDEALESFGEFHASYNASDIFISLTARIYEKLSMAYRGAQEMKREGVPDREKIHLLGILRGPIEEMKMIDHEILGMKQDFLRKAIEKAEGDKESLGGMLEYPAWLVSSSDRCVKAIVTLAVLSTESIPAGLPEEILRVARDSINDMNPIFDRHYYDNGNRILCAALAKLNDVADKAVVAMLDKARITIKFEEKPIADALREIGEAAGVPLSFDTSLKIDEAVNTEFTDATASEVLNSICELLGLKWIVVNGAVYVSSPERAAKAKRIDPDKKNPPLPFSWQDPSLTLAARKILLTAETRQVTVTFTEIPLEACIHILAELVKDTGIEIKISDAALNAEADPITLSVQNMGFLNVLVWLVRISGLKLEMTDKGFLVTSN
ncbi:MAG: hypothetical protein Kow00107_11830 [Planctomycetota bacterium]